MPSTRIKGEQVEVSLVINGVVQQVITDVKDFDATIDMEQQEEGYLGQTSNQFDEIYKGISGKMMCHFDDQGVFNTFQAIVNRAQRRTPGVKINVKATLNFPNGQSPRLLIQDCYFGPIPLSFPSRQDYGSFTLDFKSSTLAVIP